MHTIKEKLKQIYIPFNTGTFALFISLLALGYVASATNTPCISAQSTCAVGSTNEFTGNISLKGGTTYNATLDASNITADRNIELPDADGELMIGGGLSASKVVATDVSGDLTTTDIYPLSLSASKSLSTDGSGNVETNDIYPLSLTASTPLKTNGTGEVTASDLDITTDITPGSALQEIRVNSGGTALEYFTPSSGGGRWSLVAQGQMSQDTYTMGACWYDDTQGTGIGGGLDQTKVYKFVVEPTGSMSSMGNNGSYPAMVLMNETNCSNIASSSNYLYSSSVTNNGFWSINTQGWHYAFDSYANAPWLPYQQYTYSNTNGSRCGGASIEMIIRNGIGNVSVQNTKNEGVKITDMKVSAPCFDSSNLLTGWQQSDNSGMTWDSTQSYGASPVDNMNQTTGIQFKRYDGGGSFSQPVWYLYESNY